MEKIQITGMQKNLELWKQPDLRDPSHQQEMRTVARGKIKMGILWKSPNFKKRKFFEASLIKTLIKALM